MLLRTGEKTEIEFILSEFVCIHLFRKVIFITCPICNMSTEQNPQSYFKWKCAETRKKFTKNSNRYLPENETTDTFQLMTLYLTLTI